MLEVGWERMATRMVRAIIEQGLVDLAPEQKRKVGGVPIFVWSANTTEQLGELLRRQVGQLLWDRVLAPEPCSLPVKRRPATGGENPT